MTAVERSATEELVFARQVLTEAHDLPAVSVRVAAREAYIAMLHAAHARIASEGRAVPRTHRGVSAEIGRLYQGTDFDAQRILGRAERWKLASDYGHGVAARASDVEDVLRAAGAFIARMAVDCGSLDDGRLDAATLARLRSFGDEPER